MGEIELLELAAKVEGATEGSFALDKEIINALGYSWRGMAYWYHDDSHVWKGGTSPTLSLDSAMALVPEALFPTIDFVTNRVWIRDAKGFDVDYGPAHGFAATVPLSITAAALRARASITRTTGDGDGGG